jgi:N-methylhydantoinase A/oxoprolinase/acetone carboxylase beta subunit
VPLSSLDVSAVGEMLDDMETKGRVLLSKAGTPGDQVHVDILVAMRYVGQGHDVEALVERQVLDSDDQAAMRQVFEAAYKQQYGRIEENMPVEIVAWRVVVSGDTPTIDLVAARPATVEGDAKKGNREIYFGPDTGFVNAPVYNRYGLVPGSNFEGPSVFEERESTTVIPPGAKARIDDALNLVVDLPTAG